MVEFSVTQLDLAFAALADPTRRAIVDRLASAPDLSVSELAAPFALSLPAVMKHLDVLARASLIERHKTGRTVRCRLQPAAMEAAMRWLARYEQFWSDGLDRLAAFVEKEEPPCAPKPEPHPRPSPEPVSKPGQASPSSAGSRPRQAESLRRGRTRRS